MILSSSFAELVDLNNIEWNQMMVERESSSFAELVDLNWCEGLIVALQIVKLFRGACGSKLLS